MRASLRFPWKGIFRRCRSGAEARRAGESHARSVRRYGAVAAALAPAAAQRPEFRFLSHLMSTGRPRGSDPVLYLTGGFTHHGPGARLHRARGFTLLETLVALVIFAAAAMALYGVFNTNLITLARAHDVSLQVPAVRHAVEYLASINPQEEGGGRIELDGVEVVWSSKLLQPVRQSQGLTGGLGNFEIGLYEVEFAVRDGERSLGTWRLRVAGYEKVRGPTL